MPSATVTQPQHNSVLVFGATGEVGSAAALEASSRGAKVWLGMRDIEKENKWLSNQAEQNGGMKRIAADLSNPTSLTEAVEKSGAKAAYIYSVRSSDHMRSSLSALKNAGVRHIVFLSTNSVRKAWKEAENLRSITPDFFIPWKHAQVEIALEDLDIPHTTIRPGFFASNPFRMYLDTSTTPSSARVLAPDAPCDPIDPVLIGRVSGALLVDPARCKELGFQRGEKKQIVPINGPRMISQREQWKVINQVLMSESKDTVEFSEISKDEYVSNLTAMHGVPKPVAESLARSMTEEACNDADCIDSCRTIERVLDCLPTSFDDFVRRELHRYFK